MPTPSEKLAHLERFLELARASQLLELGALDTALTDFSAGARAPDSPGSDVVALGDLLIHRRLLTHWQFQMIHEGRSNEFFYGHFKFLEQFTDEGPDERFLAHDLAGDRLVILTFPGRSTDLAGTICRVSVVPVSYDVSLLFGQRYNACSKRRPIPPELRSSSGLRSNASSPSEVSMSDRIQTFAEFWPFYVREHSHPACRALHFIGSTLSLVVIAAGIVYNPWILLAAPIVGYGFAWFGHFFIEKNKPASFKYPLWSFIADWKMWAMMLSGRMGNEVQRAHAAAR